MQAIGLKLTKPLNMKYLPNLFISLFAIVLWSCSAEPQKEVKSTKIEYNQEDQKAKAEKIKKIFFALPSPLELSALFKSEGVKYEKEALHKTNKRIRYTLPHEKALNLGVYGADLSYAGLFARHEDAIEYYTACQLLADEIGMGQTFQQGFVSRIEKSPNNRDTLLQVISDFFLSNDAHLKEMNRTDISTYVLIGGWLEGMYLGSNMATKEKQTNGIDEIVVSQKNAITYLHELLTKVEESNELVDQLQQHLVTIEEAYANIKTVEVDSIDSLNSGMKSLKIDPAANEIGQDSLLTLISKEIGQARALIIQ